MFKRQNVINRLSLVVFVMTIQKEKLAYVNADTPDQLSSMTQLIYLMSIPHKDKQNQNTDVWVSLNKSHYCTAGAKVVVVSRGLV